MKKNSDKVSLKNKLKLEKEKLKRVQVSFSIPLFLKSELTNIAKENNVSLSFLVTTALTDYLEDKDNLEKNEY